MSGRCPPRVSAGSTAQFSSPGSVPGFVGAGGEAGGVAGGARRQAGNRLFGTRSNEKRQSR